MSRAVLLSLYILAELPELDSLRRFVGGAIASCRHRVHLYANTHGPRRKINGGGARPKSQAVSMKPFGDPYNMVWPLVAESWCYAGKAVAVSNSRYYRAKEWTSSQKLGGCCL